MQKSLLIISLDFELLWGVRDKRTIENYGANILGVRKVIPSLLTLFNCYGISASFATVGFLFAQNKEELQRHIPYILPCYTREKYSPYANNYFANVGNNEKEDLYHYGISLIKQIMQEGNQEIASHTFSHYYCLEQASLKSFEADMRAAISIAKDCGILIKSIVFPRNQYSAEHLVICKKLGFIAYRGNEKSVVYNPRMNENQNKVIRASRLADAYINVTGHHTHSVKYEEGIINIPASRFLRPYSKKLSPLDALRLQRIKNSMTHAAKNSEVYHLWWHPHNFGINLQNNLQFLEEVLKHFITLKKEYGMESKSMRSVAEEIFQNDAI